MKKAVASIWSWSCKEIGSNAEHYIGVRYDPFIFIHDFMSTFMIFNSIKSIKFFIYMKKILM